MPSKNIIQYNKKGFTFFSIEKSFFINYPSQKSQKYQWMTGLCRRVLIVCSLFLEDCPNEKDIFYWILLAIFQKKEPPRGLGEWKIPQQNFRSAVAVAVAFLGWWGWRGAILHNKLMVREMRCSQGLTHNGMLCNLALGVVRRWVWLLFGAWAEQLFHFFSIEKKKVLYLEKNKCQ